ncbi:hypothetical protein JCM10212_002979 [Sporobolomyces blumeae]
MQRDHVRVAVIGSGLAGLTAAHLLSTSSSSSSSSSTLEIDTHLFDKSDQLGMDNSSISIDSPHDQEDRPRYRVDVPMRSINRGSHARVKRWYDHLKVPLVKSDFTYSFSHLDPSSSPVDPGDLLDDVDDDDSTRASTPLPRYEEAISHDDDDDDDDRSSSNPRRRDHPRPTRDRTVKSNRTPSSDPRPRSPPPLIPRRTTTLLYEGSSGLKWPPLAIPSHLSSSSGSLRRTQTSDDPPSSSWSSSFIGSTWLRSIYVVHLVFLSVAYLHLVLLSFLYVKLGLTSLPPPSLIVDDDNRTGTGNGSETKHSIKVPFPFSIPLSFLVPNHDDQRLHSPSRPRRSPLDPASNSNERRPFRFPFLRSLLSSSLELDNVSLVPLDEFCSSHGVLQELQDRVLYPLMAAVCTVGTDQARQMPVGECLEYVQSTFLASHYVTDPGFGVRGIVKRLVGPVPVQGVHLATRIVRIVNNHNVDVANEEEEGRTRVRRKTTQTTTPATTKRRRRMYTIRYVVEKQKVPTPDEAEGRDCEAGRTRNRGETDDARDKVDDADANADEEEQVLEVDYIVFATQANQAALLLETMRNSSVTSGRAFKGDEDVNQDEDEEREKVECRTDPKQHDGDERTTRELDETISALRRFTYVQALVVNHTDRSFLPSDRRDQRDLNLVAYPSSSRPATRRRGQLDPGVWTTHLPPTSIETTHRVLATSSRAGSRAAPSAKEKNDPAAILQTTNPLRPVRPDLVLSSSWFSRAFVTQESKRVLARFLLSESLEGGTSSASSSLQGLALGARADRRGQPGGATTGRGGVYFCGSWCARGIPLLEGCVTSAEDAVRDILTREGHAPGQAWPF